jgi:Flp pilus assembly secretin CpaC
MTTARLRACALAFALLGAGPSAASASDQTITLAPGGGSLLRLKRPFETVLIGDPRVVDVDRRSDQSVVLKAVGLGVSIVVFVDEHGIAITNVRIVVDDART